MHKITPVFLTILLVFNSANAQEWCGNRKPVEYNYPGNSLDDKLISDRFYHTVNPSIVKYRSFQIESATTISPELYENNEWMRKDSLYNFSIYNSFALRYSFRKDFEIRLCYNDLIVKADTAIREYASTVLNTGIALGAKYLLYYDVNKPYKLALYGQLTIPKPGNMVKTYFSPEIRILSSYKLGKRMDLGCNFGTAYSNYTEKMTLLYTLCLKRYFGKRLELFTEFYKNYTVSGPQRVPNKRYLLGLGFYIQGNIYIYSSLEGGWYDEDSLSDGRIDLGLTARFL